MITEFGEGQYYLYRHIRLDKNEPFYIGIATKYPEDYLYNSYSRALKKAGRNSIWKKIVNKSDYRVEILFESDNREFILQKEIEFVKLYGRININTGILANLTNGGDYFDGYVCTPERNKKVSESNKGRKPSKESTEKRVKTRKERTLARGYTITPETREKMRLASLGRKLSPESIAKRTENRRKNTEIRGYWRHPESNKQQRFSERIAKLGVEKIKNLLYSLENDKFESFQKLSKQFKMDPMTISRLSRDNEFIKYFKDAQNKNN